VPLVRTRAALVTGALLVVSLPFAADATAPHLTCGPKQVGRWETVPVPAFHAVSGLAAPDAVTAYTVDRARPQDVAVTNGARVQISHSNGCAWSDAVALDPAVTATQPFVGAGSTIVSDGLLQGKAIAVVREGNGSTSRPHVLRYDGDSWTTSDSGLPPAGAPRLLRTASDGRTAYLTVSPTATGGSDDGTPGTPIPLPSLPPLPPPLGGDDAAATGLLYATTDGGATWELRTGPDALPTGGTGFSALELDPRDANWVFGIVNGSLLMSHDGGATFQAAEGSGYTALTPLAIFPGAVAAFDGAGHGSVFFGPRKTMSFAAPKGITSAAFRDNDSMVMVESSGVLRLVGPFGGGIAPVPAPTLARRGSLLGDMGVQSSYHAVSGHNLLRFVDPIVRAVGDPPPLAVGDTSVTPPKVGTIDPVERDVRLLLGQSATEQFTLDLPKNPTPLDLFFLVDVSTSMATYIDNLTQNIHKVVDVLTAAHIDVNVGVGTLGTAPAEGEAPYPDAYAYPPTFDPNGQVRPAPQYHKPRIYQLLRKVDRPDADFNKAINSIRLETDPPTGAGHQGTYHEGQLLAVEQAITGSGVKSQQDVDGRLSTYSAVKPGQQAGFRPNPDVRRVIVLASDETFDAPYGTPTKPGSTTASPILDFSRTLKLLNDNRVGVFGITAGSPDSVGDMTVLARGTSMLSPPGGVSCGGDPEQLLPAGAPLVCSQEGDFSEIIAEVLAHLTDRQDVHLVAPNPSRVLRRLDEHLLAGLDVKRPNIAQFAVTVSCAGVAAGTYAQDVVAMLRDYPVGRTRMYVTCLAAQAAVPPVPLAPPPAKPPVAPAVQPPVPPPAPPPAAQPQPQPNPNINPLTAGVTQEQQEMQLALALNQAAMEDDTEQVEQLAMVDRRKQTEVQALGVLAFAMTACAGLGLARLRTRTEVAVRKAR
jgi:hypothetical protein